MVSLFQESPRVARERGRMARYENGPRDTELARAARKIGPGSRTRRIRDHQLEALPRCGELAQGPAGVARKVLRRASFSRSQLCGSARRPSVRLDADDRGARRRREEPREPDSAEEVEHYRQHLLEEHLPREVCRLDPVDALALELSDFVDSIFSSRAPRVSGDQGLTAVQVAEQILAEIRAHAWDDEKDGPVGPLAVPRPSILPGPHWHLAPSAEKLPRKEAG